MQNASAHDTHPIQARGVRRAVRSHCRSFTLALALAFVATADANAQRPGEPAVPAESSAPSLPVMSLNAGIHRIMAEVADSPATRARGLMMRTRLGTNEGMLFVFEQADVHCFWMKNTPLPLSIAFIADDGSIVNIEKMQPLSEDSHCPRKAIRFALEMEQGWFAAKGIAPGGRIGGLGKPGGHAAAGDRPHK